MSSQPVPPSENSLIREKVRGYAQEQRKEGRTEAKDSLRIGLGQIKEEFAAQDNLSEKDVHGLATRIKRRKHATSEDLFRLALAFLQGVENINAFAAIPGALQVLVKELTGSDTQRQIDAAECLCNLSLGEAHVAEKISSLVGSYMVTYLDGKDGRLKRSCLWTLANILATSDKAAQQLLQMQIVPKLWKLYTGEGASNGFQEDAGICLYLISKNAAHHVNAEDREYIAHHIFSIRPEDPGSEYLMYIIHQLEIVELHSGLGTHQAECLVNFFIASLDSQADSLAVSYGVRVVANLMAINNPSLIGVLADDNIFVSALNKLFALRDPRLNMDLMRILRNFLNLNLLDSNLVLDRLQVYA
ncbi:uncharacterized protein [Drosophila bipectinata]|uniref:uncharacterized protein n=1 Tax=Drosophila bipectinata TaxID=42026 RepID=UPI001C8ABAB0|nr:uncharacterized protein LOC108124011 [Drosophila bipectinata]